MTDSLHRARELLRASRSLVVMTGAGISTESGIPDFRSPGGIWDRFDPSEFTWDNYVSNPDHRKVSWQLGLEIFPALAGAEPNPGHLAIAAWERTGRLRSIVTQNVDGLHQRAGSSPERVIEIHGTALEVVCLECGARSDRGPIQERVRAGEADPPCTACGGVLKPATISFGQAMPETETRLAFEMARTCDAFLVVGSSLVVYPAAALPAEAAQAGAPVIIVNREPTPSDALAAAVVHGSAGEILPRLLEG